jgi:AcrR family transcriptional regulator
MARFSAEKQAGGDGSERLAPRSRRGIRTREQLVDAARTVFERDGYLDARIADISKEAGLSAGSFYTYFDGKEDVFAAVVEAVEEDMLHPHLRQRLGIEDDDVIALIDAANRSYLQSYKKNARLMGVFEQVAQIDDEFRKRRLNRSNAFARRNAKMIKRLQEEGRADSEVDPTVAAYALSGMVARMAYQVYVLGERIPFERLVTTLNQLWANSLRITERPAA